MKKEYLKDKVKKGVSLLIATVIALSSSFAITPAQPAKAASTPIPAAKMVQMMGRGINLGNTLEKSGNPKTYTAVKNAVDDFINAGFTTIRIPFNWGGREAFTTGRVDSSGNVITTHTDVQTLKQIVDYITLTVNPQRISQGKREILVVVNAHHEDWAMQADIVTNKSAYDANLAKLRNIWKGICGLFKDTPHTLSFELFNEPHFAWETGSNAEASVVDMSNQLYGVIRNYMYNSTKPHQFRNIIFGGISYMGPNSLWSTFDTQAKLPGGANDGYMMGTFHSYPALDAVSTELGKWDNIYNNFAVKYGIPVYMGEYGYNHQGSITQTVKDFYRSLGNEAVNRNFSFTVWDDNGWFQIYNRTNRTFNALKNETLGAMTIPTAFDQTWFSPSNDAYVRDGSYAGTSYGSSSTLDVKNDTTAGYNRKAYFKFVLNGVSTVMEAKLRVYGNNVEDTSNVAVKAFGVENNDWSETTLTWNNAPSRQSTSQSTTNVTGTAQYYDFDVTNFVAYKLSSGSNTISLQLEAANTPSKRISFNSKESSSYKPTLIVTTKASIIPSNDAYVRGGTSSGSNFGTATTVEVKNDSNIDYLRKAYYKYVLDGVKTVNNAKLRVYGNNVEDTSAVAVKAFGVDNDNWSEYTLTYSNSPTPQSTSQSTVNITGTDRYYEFDVTGFVQNQLGDKTATIMLEAVTTSSKRMIFNSKENSSYQPELIIQ